MNDRFKFRVWDKGNEHYVDCADMLYIEPSGEITYACYDGDREDMYYYEQNDVVIEQCTGQRDKNSQLIYEGDVIELTRSRNYGWCRRGTRLEVKWNTFNCCGFGFGAIGNLTEKCASNCIVVGNATEEFRDLEKDSLHDER